MRILIEHNKVGRLAHRNFPRELSKSHDGRSSRSPKGNSLVKTNSLFDPECVVTAVGRMLSRYQGLNGWPWVHVGGGGRPVGTPVDRCTRR